METLDLDVGQRNIHQGFQAPDRKRAVPKVRSCEKAVSTGVLYAHALAIEYEAEARFREVADFMLDPGDDTAAELFLRLAENEAQYALHLVKTSVGIEIPVIDADEYAWLDNGVPVPEARALVFRMMTPRLALEAALRAKEQAKAFFMREWARSRNVVIRELAAELALDQELLVAWVKDALARLPQPLQPSEEHAGDPTIEQCV